MQFIGQLKELEPSNLSLYIHIPFCTSRCAYCAFTSFVKNQKTIDAYYKKILSELKEVLKTNVKFDTIYIGGGNPISIGSVNLLNLIKVAQTNNKASEVNIECNSADITKDLLLSLNNNISRLSIGFQALNDEALKTIGRKSSVRENLNALNLIRQTEIEYDINIDFICNIQNHKTADLLKEIQLVIDEPKVKHLSIYSLTLEENTKLTNSTYEEVEEKLQADQLERVWNYLDLHGFTHYEISAFARENYQCCHNMVYWNLDNYIGLGVSAGSYINKVITTGTYSLDKYINSSILTTYESEEPLTLSQELETYLLVKLRTFEGLDLEYIKQRFNVDLTNILNKPDKNMYVFKNNKFVFSKKGMLLCDNNILKIISLLD